MVPQFDKEKISNFDTAKIALEKIFDTLNNLIC